MASPVASNPATGDDGTISSTTFWIVLLCFVLFLVANIICVRTPPPPRGEDNDVIIQPYTGNSPVQPHENKKEQSDKFYEMVDYHNNIKQS